MNSNHEEDVFIAVRVQDPRIQNEGSWNSHVDYKIFLHTNSKAFTAKTSCVRRRYSEFVWLKKKMQKNAGLVPVPDLPGKSLLYFNNEDFLERRRKGLQVFLDKVLHMTVCLSDSLLHLFLQTQLPVGHIQDCVQGHTPYSVTDAILTYASSNRGLVQAQTQDDLIMEPSLTAVPYESMESPAPHLPCLPNKETTNPWLLSSSDPDPLQCIVVLQDQDTLEIQLSHNEKSSQRILQKNDRLEAIEEKCCPAKASFFLGDSQDDLTPEKPNLAQQTQQRSCQIQTPVEVHSPMGVSFEDYSEVELEKGNIEDCTVIEESHMTLETAKKTVPSVPHPGAQEEAGHEVSLEEGDLEKVNCEPEVPEQHIGTESILENVISEEPVLEHHVVSEVTVLEHVGSSEDRVPDVNRPEETQSSDGQMDPDKEQGDDPGNTNEMALKSAVSEATQNLLEVESVGDDGIQRKDPPLDRDLVKQEVDLVETSNKEDSDEDSQSLPSSNGSIAKVSDEGHVCDEKEDDIQNANRCMEASPEEAAHWSEVEASSTDVLEPPMNGCPMDTESISDVHDAHEDTNRVTGTKDEDLPYVTSISSLAETGD